jgi:rhodanese-related sulfurtransferase
MNHNMSPDEFQEVAENAVILDVRTPMEYEQGHIPGARNIDISGPEFMDTISGLDREQPYALYCRSGSRSGMAVQLMQQLGFKEVGHLETGLLDWNRELVQGSADRVSE